MKKRKGNRVLKFLALILFLIAILIIVIDKLKLYQKDYEENKAVEEYIENQEKLNEEQQEETPKEEEKETPKKQTQNNYIGVLEIPKINFKRGFLDKKDKNNNVNKNIQVLDKSDTPDNNNGNVIIAGHSGNCSYCYFSKLDKLELNDYAYIYYNGKKYFYTLKKIYDVDKTGSVVIDYVGTNRLLTLITCRKDDLSKQTLFIFELNKIDLI